MVDVSSEDPLNPNLAIRQYLEQHNITASLLEALEELTADKPDDPVKYIGMRLLKDQNMIFEHANAVEAAKAKPVQMKKSVTAPRLAPAPNQEQVEEESKEVA